MEIEQQIIDNAEASLYSLLQGVSMQRIKELACLLVGLSAHYGKGVTAQELHDNLLAPKGFLFLDELKEAENEGVLGRLRLGKEI